MQLAMKEAEYKTLKRLIETEFGLSLKTHTRETLAKKIQPRLRALNLNSFPEYCEYLSESPRARIEFHDLPGYIMNTESYFLREFAQFHAFLEIFRKKKREKIFQTDRTFKILSAGCAEGQEPYSISMVLKTSSDNLHGWKIQIHGLDVNVYALDKAQSGVYSGYSLRGPHTKMIEHYFQKTKASSCDTPRECYRLKPEIIRSVEYRHGNILKPLVLQGLEKLDFIFCRNVLMYMSENAIDRIALNLWEALADDGHLFIGQSESLRKHDNLFTAVRHPDVTFYRKKPACMKNDVRLDR